MGFGLGLFALAEGVCEDGRYVFRGERLDVVVDDDGVVESFDEVHLRVRSNYLMPT